MNYAQDKGSVKRNQVSDLRDFKVDTINMFKVLQEIKAKEVKKHENGVTSYRCQLYVYFYQ